MPPHRRFSRSGWQSSSTAQLASLRYNNAYYRKFLNALPIYGADVAVMLGDLTGKVLVPMVEKSSSTWECTLMGQHVDIETQDELAKVKKTVENSGYYWVHQTRDEFEATRADPAKIDTLFKRLVLERVQEWLDLADERLEGKPYQMYMCPGNDDWFVIDDMIDAARLIHPCDRRVVEFEGHEMVTSSASNPTPWDTPREMAEADLEVHLQGLCELVKDYETAIFNFHVPPHGYSLDLCPKLDDTLTMSAEEKIHAGSIGAKKMVEKYQPLLGLFGHIHE